MKTKVEIWKLAIAMLSTAMFAACSENSLEPIIETTTDEVAFDVAVKQVDTVSISLSHTRSTDRGMGLPMGSFEMSDNGNTIYANQLAVGMIDAHNNVARSKTRGTEKTSANFYSSFGLYGYFYGEAQSWSNTMTPIISEEITQTSGSWKATKAWPGKSKGTFFAWAPYSTTDLIVSSSSTPSITYTVPSTVSSQQDILVCKTAELSSSKNPISLDFKHALTAVRFVVGNIGYFTEIKSIKIEDVYNIGTLEIGASTWTGTSGTASYEITGPFTISSLGTDELIGGELMLLMPQTLPATAKLTVVMANGANEQTFTANLNGSNWPMGNTVTYKLSVEKIEGEYKFEVTPSAKYVEIGGGSVDFTVKSYYEYRDGHKVPVAWSCGNATTQSGSGGESGDSFSFSVTSNSGNVVTHNSLLQSRASKGTTGSPWNLSNKTGASNIENTANCYVVGSKGTYSLPLVYGNAIKDGQTNAIAYNVDSPTGTFVNHLGYQITNPYIYENYSGGGTSGNKLEASSVALVWQDVNGLIEKSTLRLSDDKHSIIFSIGSNIAQGNALLAVKDADGKIMWSWHIWVTDRDEDMRNTETITTLDGQHDNDFMNYPVGWCDKDQTGVLSRSFTLDFTQNGSGKTFSQKIIQDGTTTKDGNALFYEWGRKDPIGANNNEYNDFKTRYDIDGNTFTNGVAEATSMSNAIQNPNVYYKYGNTTSNWATSDSYDNWNAIGGKHTHTANGTYSEIVKTVYDPSPIGFRLWSGSALSVFTSSGTSSNYGAIINSKGVYTDSGWYLYTNSSKTRTSFWKLCGNIRYSSKGFEIAFDRSDYWSAEPRGQGSGSDLYITSSIVSPQEGDARAYGFFVRPVEE